MKPLFSSRLEKRVADAGIGHSTACHRHVSTSILLFYYSTLFFALKYPKGHEIFCDSSKVRLLPVPRSPDVLQG
ncbi:hypothetical protein D5086_022371 [Populus alba]|uniref:Uncharacterized protein n=1 Tax=Populus alba TaxID=43335 RepID=A0ACC4BET9_POPAL